MLPRLLQIFELVLGILLISAILLKQRGSGLSGVFGGEGNIYRTKRGIEKILFQTTIVIAVLFFAVAFASMLIARG